MKSFAAVVIGSMQLGSNNGYVGAIDYPHYVRNLVEVLKLLYISLHNGRKMLLDEFLEHICFYGNTELGILYKSAMHCIELHVANLEIDTTTFT